MAWDKNKIDINGTYIDAQMPVIVSASRSTDIPAFYSDWFVDRWQKGYIKWINPFNGKPLYVSFDKTKLVVFWTKNPKPMMKHIDWLEKNIQNFYFQFSLNDYDNEKYEAKVPSVSSRIDTFIALSNRLGKKRVVWRYDPLILTNDIDINELLKRVKNIGDKIYKYTDKLVFSFVDIGVYKKVQSNLQNEQVQYIEWTPQLMEEFAIGIAKINQDWGLKLGTCCESIELDKYNIVHNKCIDDDLMIDVFSDDKVLMDFLGVEIIPADLFSDGKIIKNKKLKDKGQREVCGCIVSKDIGQYNTCPHECNYCYANSSKTIAIQNYKKHLNNPFSDGIIG